MADGTGLTVSTMTRSIIDTAGGGGRELQLQLLRDLLRLFGEVLHHPVGEPTSDRVLDHVLEALLGNLREDTSLLGLGKESLGDTLVSTRRKGLDLLSVCFDLVERCRALVGFDYLHDDVEGITLGFLFGQCLLPATGRQDLPINITEP